jgi:hypothetical protein
LKRRQFDKAVAKYEASLKFDPDRARALYGRGYARSKKGETPAGINDMSAAAGIQPDIADESKSTASIDQCRRVHRNPDRLRGRTR